MDLDFENCEYPKCDLPSQIVMLWGIAKHNDSFDISDRLVGFCAELLIEIMMTSVCKKTSYILFKILLRIKLNQGNHLKRIDGKLNYQKFTHKTMQTITCKPAINENLNDVHGFCVQTAALQIQ